MNRIDGLMLQKTSLMDQIDQCWDIKNYIILKSKILDIDYAIKKEESFENYALMIKVKERIDELENKKQNAIKEINRTKDGSRSRKLLEMVEVINKTIAINKEMLGGF